LVLVMSQDRRGVVEGKSDSALWLLCDTVYLLRILITYTYIILHTLQGRGFLLGMLPIFFLPPGPAASPLATHAHWHRGHTGHTQPTRRASCMYYVLRSRGTWVHLTSH
jgi:hypothetical protein